MIALTTPTGQIGSKVLKKLIAGNAQVRVLIRDPEKLSEKTRNQVEIVQGSLDDAKSVAKVFNGADTVFFNIPPSMQYQDVKEYYTRFGRIACNAIKSQGVKRVVFISGTGLGFEKKAGPVAASYLVEKMIEETVDSSRILHCGAFMENIFHSLESLKNYGAFGNAVPADVSFPFVATRDIAEVVSRLLLDNTWIGHESVGVLGPKDLSYREISKQMSEVLDRPILYQEFSAEQLKTNMMKFGATKAAAEALVEASLAIKNKMFSKVTRTPESTTSTSFATWLEEEFKPAFQS